MEKIISKKFRVIVEQNTDNNFCVTLEHKIRSGVYFVLSKKTVYADSEEESIKSCYDYVVLNGVSYLCDGDENAVLDTLRANHFYDMSNGDLQGLVENYLGC